MRRTVAVSPDGSGAAVEGGLGVSAAASVLGETEDAIGTCVPRLGHGGRARGQCASVASMTMLHPRRPRASTVWPTRRCDARRRPRRGRTDRRRRDARLRARPDARTGRRRSRDRAERCCPASSMPTPTTRSTRPRARCRSSRAARTPRSCAAAARHAALALRAGITTARGAGSIRNLEVVLRDRIAAGRAAGPRIVAAGTAVGAVDGHGAAFGLEASGPAGARRRRSATVIADGRRRGQGRRLGGGDADDDRPRAGSDGPRRAGADRGRGPRHRRAAAADRGRRVMSHAQDDASVVRSARAGVASVEHAWLADEAAIEALAWSGTGSSRRSS